MVAIISPSTRLQGKGITTHHHLNTHEVQNVVRVSIVDDCAHAGVNHSF